MLFGPSKNATKHGPDPLGGLLNAFGGSDTQGQ